MKILLINKYLYPKGGAETYTLKLGEYLSGVGHEVEYFGMYDKKNVVHNSIGQYTQNMDFHDSGAEKFLYPFRIIYSFQARKKLRKVLKDFQPDIVHMNNINYQLTPSIIDEIKKQGIPIVQTVHDLQMLCPNHLMFDLNKKSPCEKCLNGSKINCIKGKCIHYSRVKSVIGAIEAWLYAIKGTYKKVDKYICPSRFLESKLLEKKRIGEYIYRGKTVAIHNYIELPDIDFEHTKKNYVLFFGRLSEEKGVDIFIEACKSLPNIMFKVAGVGPMENACKGIPNVEFVGFKTGRDLHKLIAEALFSIYPSIWYENCPLSILESESFGTPVICTPLGGMPELVENGKTGVILEEVSSKALTEAISALYNDRELCEKMSKNCEEKRTQMINLNEYGRRIEKVYSEILKK